MVLAKADIVSQNLNVLENFITVLFLIKGLPVSIGTKQGIHN